MNCYRCGFANDAGARFCNNCGTAVNVVQQQSKNSNVWKLVLAGIVGLCVLSGIINSFKSKDATPSSQSTPTTSKPPDPEARWNSTSGKIEAFVMSQTFMKRKLKAPATADFPSYSDSDVSVVHRGGGVFMVKSYVDAQNSFGANIRTHYICELKDNGGDSWSLISMLTP